MGKNDKKSGDKGGGKGKGSEGKEGGGKAKGAMSINVRHILCEKHARKEEALLKLSEGVKFDEVARAYSEDKARQGIRNRLFLFALRHFINWCFSGDGLLIILFLFAAGGSLGWKIKGSLDPTFEEVAFSLEPSTTSNPKIGEAKTPFGYHIIMVEGRK
ncbi:uncharacterized protein Triagg1_6588 [Trichoderma aggressivum f. europaeum]|uniref:Peptidyl-prolyl cis-trans isomerase n=1 Tax=Trichoderma aggressivum f. europaeum TaxID=173218 RepID=A0AAE1IDK1_9HYPO|nr:hypothetical protein Triagg1_6588 [Trichoderma aggressivum f. europaeum]